MRPLSVSAFLPKAAPRLMPPSRRLSHWLSPGRRRAISAAVVTCLSLRRGRAGPPSCLIFGKPLPPPPRRRCLSIAASRTAHRRVGVPGTVRGLALAHARFWQIALEGAGDAGDRALAKEGFLIDAATADSLNAILRKTPKDFAEFHRTFGKPGGGSWRGRRPARFSPRSPRLWNESGTRGPTASTPARRPKLIVAEMRRGGGLITERGSRLVPARSPRPGPRHLSGLRNYVDSALFLRRHDAVGDVEYSREFRSPTRAAAGRPRPCI